MNYAELLPRPELRPWVRCYWFLRAVDDEPPGPPEPALPDGSPELIFNLGDPFLACAASGERTLQPLAMLVGQITSPFTVAPTGDVNLVAVRFTPAGASVLCNDMASITNHWAAIDTLPVPALRSLHSQLARASGVGADSQASCASLLDAVLMRIIADRRTPDEAVALAVRAIDASHGMIVLEALAADIGCSLRHLQRRFAKQVGISPKLLARIRRFQRVFAAWQSDPRSLAAVAATCGYFDQPHLVRDFRAFAGTAPAEFLAAPPEFTQLFLPSTPRHD
jgi:AraC-like DNA-binding protein